MKCLQCQKDIPDGRKYCSLQCKGTFTYQESVDEWKARKIVGHKGKAMVVKPFVRRYLYEKYDGKCCQCGWCVPHQKTGIAPLETDHIDGDASNTWEENLRLLCPNCHSLTPYHKHHNKNGKRFRQDGAI